MTTDTVVSEFTTIRVAKTTQKRLLEFGAKEKSYDKVIIEMLDALAEKK